MEYLNYVKSKAHIGTSKKSEAPVLTEEDEQFLNRVTSHDEKPPPLPARSLIQDLPVAGDAEGNDAQLALFDGAQNVALPETPDEPTRDRELAQNPNVGSDNKPTKNTWSWLRRDSRDHKRKVRMDSVVIRQLLTVPSIRPMQQTVLWTLLKE
jgi:hypothetical protein